MLSRSNGAQKIPEYQEKVINMEVLEKGKDLEWSEEIKCPSCKSKLKVTSGDIYCGGGYGYYTACSACNHKIDIQQEERYSNFVFASDAFKQNFLVMTAFFIIATIIIEAYAYLERNENKIMLIGQSSNRLLTTFPNNRQLVRT
jgi:DNA-directed RNA polymerase subunit RPC12/RpoP